MNIIKIVIVLIIAISFGIGAYLYPSAPDLMPSHWNVHGQVDGYSSKAVGLFLMPVISLVMFLLFLLLPKIDPLKENIKKFREYFDRFILLLILFLFYMYILTILWTAGQRFDMGQFMAPMMGVLFFYAGILMEKAKRNWFIGIRTPWTLSSDKVWDKTHKLGSKLFKISGICAILGFFLPKFVFSLIFFPVIISALYTFLYSYLVYRKEK